MSSADEATKRPTVSAEEGGLLATVRNLWGYMWPEGRPDLKWRVILAIGALLVSKVATTLIPFVYKWIIDSLDGTTPDTALVMGIAIPIVVVVAFGVGNIIDAGFQQLRDVLFASVGQHAVREPKGQAVDEDRLAGRRGAKRVGKPGRRVDRGPPLAAPRTVERDALRHLVIPRLRGGDVGPRRRQRGDKLLGVGAFARTRAAEKKSQARPRPFRQRSRRDVPAR